MGAELITVGHGRLPAPEFTDLVRGAGVAAIVDVRIAPGSRRHPHFARAAMAGWLPDVGVTYRWERRLGGFRKLAPDSPDVALRNDSLRAYAGYMRTPPFRAALTELLAAIERVRTAVMCSETLWFGCHRRLIADAATLLHGVPVRHLLPDGRLAEHEPTDGVRVDDGQLVYDLAPVTPPRADTPASPPSG